MSNEYVNKLKERLKAQGGKLSELENDAGILDASSDKTFSQMEEFGGRLFKFEGVAKNASDTMAQLEKEAEYAKTWRSIDTIMLASAIAALIITFLLAPAFYEQINFAVYLSAKNVCINALCGALLYILIDFVIFIVYRAFIDKPREYISSRIYDIKPFKIIFYSNTAASVLHILYAAISCFLKIRGTDSGIYALLSILFSGDFWASVNIGGIIITVLVWLIIRPNIKNSALNGLKDAIRRV